MHRLIICGVFLVLALGISSRANSDFEIKFKSANVFSEFGNIVNARVELGEDTISNMWVQRYGGTFDLQADNGESLTLYLGMGSIFWHAIPVVDQTDSKIFRGNPILSKAYAAYNFGEIGEPKLEIKFGFFPVKYSSSRNLGEYMFRTGTYPNYIISGNGLTVVNTSSTGILGFQGEHSIGEFFSHSLFFTSERQSIPLHDLSVTYMAQFHIGALNVGAGAQLSRLIPVRPSQTTPKVIKNSYFEYQGESYTGSDEYYRSARATDSANASGTFDAGAYSYWIAVADSVKFLVDNRDSLGIELDFYSFKGVKPVIHASIDFKKWLGSSLFQKDELILYGEGVLMGVQDKPFFYEERMDRVALMLGINLPTFGVLDHLNLEMERFTSNYVNGYRAAVQEGLPIPDYMYQASTGYDPTEWGADDVKWSVYLSRTLLKGLTLEGQFARDHFRGKDRSLVVSEPSLLVKENHWYYMFKLQAKF